MIGSFFGNGPADGNIQAFLSTASVPEPGSLALLAIGVAGAGALAFYRRRRLSTGVGAAQT